MEINNANSFIEDLMYDDNFAEKCESWYKNDVVIILTQNEIKELHIALNEWIENNNIVRVQTVAKINNDISKYLNIRNDEGELI